MAFSRKFLAALGIEQDKIDEIISAHVEVTDALKEQRDSYKADADKLAEVQKQLDKANADLETAKSDGWKEKFDALNTEYTDYKTSVTAEKSNAAKSAAYRQLLKDAGIKGDKLIDTILGTVDMSKIEMIDGKIKDADSISSSVKSDWADYIGITTEHGENVNTPPANNNIDYDSMSDEEFYKAYKKGS